MTAPSRCMQALGLLALSTVMQRESVPQPVLWHARQGTGHCSCRSPAKAEEVQLLAQAHMYPVLQRLLRVRNK